MAKEKIVLSLYQAAEIVDVNDRSRQAIEYLGKAARLLVRQQQYEEALKIISREIDAHISVSLNVSMWLLVASSPAAVCVCGKCMF